MSKSWRLKDYICGFCEYEIVVTQGHIGDYRYYCSNLDCYNHTHIEDIGDTEECSFAWNPKDGCDCGSCEICCPWEDL